METPAGLAATEAECAIGRTAPRVSLADIEAAVSTKLFFTADQLAVVSDGQGPIPQEDWDALTLLTICVIVLKNGFTIIGKSAPVSAANFDAELGRNLAYEDAVRQVWPLMGFALKDRLLTDAAKIA